MTKTIPIVLSQLVLWCNAPRIQSWPELLSAIPADVFFKTPTDFGRKFLSDRMTDPRHIAASKTVRNLPGLETTGGKIVLKGVGLLEKEKSGYRLSAAGNALAETFRQDPGGDQWVGELARLLLLREPRCRAAVRALSQPGARLVFPGEWFSQGARNAVLEDDAGPCLKPFHPVPSNVRRCGKS